MINRQDSSKVLSLNSEKLLGRKLRAYALIEDTEDTRDLFVATTKDGAKSYPVYAEVKEGLLLVPSKQTRRVIKDPKSLDDLPFTLRDYQTGPVQETIDQLRSKYGVFLKAACGCIHGEALIGVNRAGKGFKVKLKDLVSKLNDTQDKYPWDLSIPTYVQRMEDDSTIRLGRIKAAWFSGVKTVYQLKAKGYSTKATEEHPFLTGNGWKKLSELKVGDQVYVKDPNREAKNKAGKKSYIRRRAGHHPHSTSIGIVNERQLVIEADLNGLTYGNYMERLKSGNIEGLRFVDTKIHAIHHKDRKDKNNDLDNLRLMTHSAHQKLHIDEDGSVSKVLFRTKLVTIDSIDLVGEEATYDIEVEDDPHNFIADDFVVHNTGKTIMAIAVAKAMRMNRVVILVDQVKLADQWVDRIEEFLPGETIAVFHGKADKVGSMKENQARFLIVVAQSMRTTEWVDDPLVCDMLICDEAHVFSAPRFCQCIYNFDFDYSIALTATEDRRDELTWVFMRFLASSQVSVEAEALRAKVTMPKVTVRMNWKDYAVGWCMRNMGMVWHAKCKVCPSYDKFPTQCGGKLKGDYGIVDWNEEKIMWTPMLMGLFEDPQYVQMLADVVIKFQKANRQVLIFNQFREPLKRIMEIVSKEVGEEHCGMFISGTKDPDAALQKQLTFTTYAIAKKGIDCPWKDATILSSPVSDIRQTVGRITRMKDGKKQPLVFDPIITNVPMFTRQANLRKRQYRELNFDF